MANDLKSNSILDLWQVWTLRDKFLDPLEKLELVLILDGFDEMRPEHRAQNLWRTNDLGALWPALKDAEDATVGKEVKPKLIVLCRSEMLAGQIPSEYLKVHPPSPLQGRSAGYQDHFQCSPIVGAQAT